MRSWKIQCYRSQEGLFLFASLYPTCAVTGIALTTLGGPHGKARLIKIKALLRASLQQIPSERGIINFCSDAQLKRSHEKFKK